MKNGPQNIKDQSTATTQKVSVRKRTAKGEKKDKEIYFDSTKYWEKRNG